MKKTLITLMLGTFIVSSSVFSQTSMIAYWDFEEDSGTTVTDSIDGEEGVINGGVEFTADGKFGSAVSFNGTDGFISTEILNPFLELDEITVMAWFNTNDNLAQQHIVWVGETGGNGWGAQAEFHISLNQFHEDFQEGYVNTFYGSSDMLENGVCYLNEDNPVDAETWYHVAVTLREMGELTQAELFLDGELVEAVDWDDKETDFLTGSTESPSPINREKFDMPFRIGGAGNTNRFFNGLIDEVRIYNGALAVDDIKNAMAGGLTSSKSFNSNNSSFIFPTTGSGIFTIKNHSNIDFYQVIDMNCRTLLKNQSKIGNTLNLSHLEQGVYVVKLQVNNKVHTQKIMIK